jgi:hypothetical protein
MPMSEPLAGIMLGQSTLLVFFCAEDHDVDLPVLDPADPHEIA